MNLTYQLPVYLSESEDAWAKFEASVDNDGKVYYSLGLASGSGLKRQRLDSSGYTDLDTARAIRDQLNTAIKEAEAQLPGEDPEPVAERFAPNLATITVVVEGLLDEFKAQIDRLMTALNSDEFRRRAL